MSLLVLCRLYKFARIPAVNAMLLNAMMVLLF
jgi:hypothetical protein